MGVGFFQCAGWGLPHWPGWGDGLWSWLLHWGFAASRFGPVGWGAEKAPDFTLSLNSGKNLSFLSDQFCLWQTFLPMWVVVSAVFLLFCFLGPGWGFGAVKASSRVLAGACLVCLWGGVGLVCPSSVHH